MPIHLATAVAVPALSSNCTAKIHTLFVLRMKNTFFNTNLTFIYILHKKHKSVQCSINYIILYVHIYGTRFLRSGRLFSVRCKVVGGGVPYARQKPQNVASKNNFSVKFFLK